MVDEILKECSIYRADNVVFLQQKIATAAYSSKRKAKLLTKNSQITIRNFRKIFGSWKKTNKISTLFGQY
jgi:hypothetical protein